MTRLKTGALVLGAAASLSLAGLPAAAHGIHEDDPRTLDADRDIALPLELENFEQANPKGGVSIRGVLDSLSLWPLNKLITVCFIGGDTERRKLFAEASKEWLSGLSIRMAFGTGATLFDCAVKPDTDIRVGFMPGSSWSLIGTQALTSRKPGDPTLNIGYGATKPFAEIDKAHLRSVMLHETGHALGLKHEHQSPDFKCDDELDWDMIYSALVNPPEQTRESVTRNFRRLVASPRFRHTPYDPKSIMHYALPASYFKAKETATCYVKRNYALSDADLGLIRATYPKTQAERDAHLARATAVASATLAPTPLSSGELAGFAAEVTKLYRALETKAALDFDFRSTFGAKSRESDEVETRSCDRVVSSAKPAAGVRCEIATDASFLSIGGE